FSSFENLAGDAGADSFFFDPSGTLSGTVDGGAASDTLIGNNNGDTFNVTNTDAGNIAGILPAGFSSVENLTGGTGADSLVLSGTVNGGAGVDSLSYAANATVTLTGSAANGYSGNDGGVDTGGFSNVNAVAAAGGTDKLVGEDTASTWTLDGAGFTYDDLFGN